MNSDSIAIEAATDGACSGNPGPGGWGGLIMFEDNSEVEIGGSEQNTTNNRKELKEKKGIEIGHIFQLGQKYSEKLNAKFSDKDGQLKNLWMGCYGIGVTRIAQAAIEQNHDQKGICWPIQISPIVVIIIPTNLKDPIQSDLTEQIYNNFLINKIDVLLDDRNDRAGVIFKDAELIGIPFQIIIGRDSVNKEVELLCRTNNTKLKISTDKLLETFIFESEIMYNKKSWSLFFWELSYVTEIDIKIII